MDVFADLCDEDVAKAIMENSDDEEEEEEWVLMEPEYPKPELKKNQNKQGKRKNKRKKAVQKVEIVENNSRAIVPYRFGPYQLLHTLLSIGYLGATTMADATTTTTTRVLTGAALGGIPGALVGLLTASAEVTAKTAKATAMAGIRVTALAGALVIDVLNHSWTSGQGTVVNSKVVYLNPHFEQPVADDIDDEEIEEFELDDL